MTEPGEVESQTGVGLLVLREVDSESLAVSGSVLDPAFNLVMDVVREGDMCDVALGPQDIDCVSQVSWGRGSNSREGRKSSQCTDC